MTLNDDVIKKVNSFCVAKVIQKDQVCTCRIHACFHAGQLDLALQILQITGFPIQSIKKPTPSLGNKNISKEETR